MEMRRRRVEMYFVLREKRSGEKMRLLAGALL
jgi:hypothetical protein